MNAFDALLAGEESGLINELGRSVVYQPVTGGRYPVQAIVDEFSEEMHNDASTIGVMRDKATILLNSSVNASSGDLITVDNIVYYVELVTAETPASDRCEVRKHAEI